MHFIVYFPNNVLDLSRNDQILPLLIIIGTLAPPRHTNGIMLKRIVNFILYCIAQHEISNMLKTVK